MSSGTELSVHLWFYLRKQGCKDKMNVRERTRSFSDSVYITWNVWKQPLGHQSTSTLIFSVSIFIFTQYINAHFLSKHISEILNQLSIKMYYWSSLLLLKPYVKLLCISCYNAGRSQLYLQIKTFIKDWLNKLWMIPLTDKHVENAREKRKIP
jgi:hypothetical protein